MQHNGNLSTPERTVSAVAGAVLAVLSARQGGAIFRTLSGAAGAALLARAFAGHCAVKSALRGDTTLAGGVADQWKRMSGKMGGVTHGLPGSPAHAATSDRVDEAVDQSFPASDPPASRIPDEPPVNAEAKWEAARAASR